MAKCAQNKETLQVGYVQLQHIKPWCIHSNIQQRAGSNKLGVSVLTTPTRLPTSLCWPGNSQAGKGWSSSLLQTDPPLCSAAILHGFFPFKSFYLSTLVFSLLSPWATNWIQINSNWLVSNFTSLISHGSADFLTTWLCPQLGPAVGPPPVARGPPSTASWAPLPLSSRHSGKGFRHICTSKLRAHQAMTYSNTVEGSISGNFYSRNTNSLAKPWLQNTQDRWCPNNTQCCRVSRKLRLDDVQSSVPFMIHNLFQIWWGLHHIMFSQSRICLFVLPSTAQSQIWCYLQTLVWSLQILVTLDCGISFSQKRVRKISQQQFQNNSSHVIDFRRTTTNTYTKDTQSWNTFELPSCKKQQDFKWTSC